MKNTKKIRRFRFFPDIKKEEEFLNTMLHNSYLLIDLNHHVYTFKTTDVYGLYYISYTTQDKQTQEVLEQAEEIAYIRNSRFFSIHNLLKKYSPMSSSEQQLLNGHWHYYFFPHCCTYIAHSDRKRKFALYKKITTLKLYDILTSMLLFFMIPLFLSCTSNISLFPYFFTPTDLFHQFAGQHQYFFLIVCMLALFMEYSLLLFLVVDICIFIRSLHLTKSYMHMES